MTEQGSEKIASAIKSVMQGIKYGIAHCTEPTDMRTLNTIRMTLMSLHPILGDNMLPDDDALSFQVGLPVLYTGVVRRILLMERGTVTGVHEDGRYGVDFGQKHGVYICSKEELSPA